DILRQDARATLASEVAFLLSVLGYCGLAFYNQPPQMNMVLIGACLLGFGYLLPRSLAGVISESFLFYAWPLLTGLTWLFTPAVLLIEATDMLVHRMAGREDPSEIDSSLISEEIRTVIDEGEREGMIKTSAGRIIQRLMEIQHEDVTAVMTPRTEMICIQVDTPLEEVRKQLVEAGHSRVPVYRESPDDLVGILYAKDLLQKLYDKQQQQTPLTSFLREPLYVPESTGIEALLERMRGEHVHMAIVLDEYGGVAGLVTMEDILEEIVGEVEDEFDKVPKEEIRKIKSGLFEVDARVHIDDLNEQFDLQLPEDEDYETIGGFVFSQFGKIPEQNETLTWNNLKITILDVDKRKLIKLKVERDDSLVVNE
ncbi:MAG: HlyC/CorC family transporter, partial [Planctomycetaceae bacterium]|nr:HlyC/CorC family transporter [Planctomycetaceae bacterium]